MLFRSVVTPPVKVRPWSPSESHGTRESGPPDASGVVGRWIPGSVESSTVLYAEGITNDSVFITRLTTALRDFMEADGLAFAYDRFLMPRTGVIRFASTFNRSVTGSMNELIAYAKAYLADEETSPFDLGFRLNDLLLSALASDQSSGYGKPRDAFQALLAESIAP